MPKISPIYCKSKVTTYNKIVNRVVHFEIHADDIERAKKFYGDVFGWDSPAYKR